MANLQYFDVILRPVVTEKSMADMSEKKYTSSSFKRAAFVANTVPYFKTS